MFVVVYGPCFYHFISSVSTLIMAFVEALLVYGPPRSWPGAKPSPEATRSVAGQCPSDIPCYFPRRNAIVHNASTRQALMVSGLDDI